MQLSHILFVTPAFPPFPGGGERYAHSLARALQRRGVRLTVVTSAAAREADFWQGSRSQTVTETLEAGLRIIRCPLRPVPGGFTGLLAWRKLMVLLSALPGEQTAILQRMCRLIPPIQELPSVLVKLPDVDLVHGFNVSWEYALIEGWRWAQRRGVPFVMTPFTHFGTGRDRVERNSTMDHQRRMFREAAKVLVLTAVEQTGLAALGVPLDRMDVLGSGLDVVPALADEAVLPQRYRLQQPYVIFIGRNSFEKGAIHAAKAVLALRQAGSEVRLVLVGQVAGEFERFYGRLSPHKQQAIHPLGIVSEQEKHALLHGAEMLLLPSRTDSFGLVLLEAWAHGKPVIGARAGGIPSVIDHTHNGLLVEFGDVPGLAEAIHALLSDASKRRTMGANGRDKVQTQYNWQQVGERVWDNYEVIMQRGRVAGGQRKLF